MPRGAPDDSDVRREGITVRIDDMGELAVRMGSSMNYHRGGELVFLDTFEAGLAAWRVYKGADDTVVLLSSDYALSSGISVYCDTGVLLGNSWTLEYQGPPLETDMVGFHIAFSTAEANMEMQFEMQIRHLTTRFIYEVTYDYATGILECHSTNHPWIEFGIQKPLALGERIFHHAKMIVNYKIPYYHKFFLDEHEYDLSPYEVRTWAGDYAPLFYANLNVDLDTGVQNIMYIDDAIITQNEV